MWKKKKKKKKKNQPFLLASHLAKSKAREKRIRRPISKILAPVLFLVFNPHYRRFWFLNSIKSKESGSIKWQAARNFTLDDNMSGFGDSAVPHDSKEVSMEKTEASEVRLQISDQKVQILIQVMRFKNTSQIIHLRSTHLLKISPSKILQEESDF